MTDTAAGRIQAFLDARPDRDEHESSDIILTEVDPDRARGRWLHLTRADLRAILDEREQLAARFAELEAHPWIEVVWLTADKEGNYGVWNDPDHAREQLASGYTAASPGTYEWVTDADWTHELLLRDGEPTGLRLWMAHVADAARAETGSGEPQTTHDTETDHA